jgi:hypothetical protein
MDRCVEIVAYLNPGRRQNNVCVGDCRHSCGVDGLELKELKARRRQRFLKEKEIDLAKFTTLMNSSKLTRLREEGYITAGRLL